MKQITEEIEGHLLDYAVLLADGAPDGYTIRPVENYWVLVPSAPRKPTFVICNDQDYLKFSLLGSQHRRYRPSADWAATGVILERERIALMPSISNHSNSLLWSAVKLGENEKTFVARSPIVAVLRCFVAGKLGEEFDA